MNAISINICGLSQAHKQDWLNESVRKFNLHVLGIRETKLENVNRLLVNSIWGNSECDFCYGSSNGASGGTLLIWNQIFF